MLATLRITEKNRLTKLQNPVKAPTAITKIQMLAGICKPSLEVVENVEAVTVVVVTEEAKLPMAHQPVEQTILKPPTTQATTARIPASTIIK